jgi:hypothetical protein
MKKYINLVLLLLALAGISAQNLNLKTAKGFSLGADFAYYPKSDKLPGSLHFSPITGPFSGLEFRVVPSYSYTIFTPFSESPLVSGNNVKLKTALELSPVSFCPSVSLSFTPIAFLVFSVGSKIGSGWTFTPMNVNGMASYNSASQSYEALSPFSSLYHSIWFEGLFQFDLAAVLPGEWNHVVFVASYKPFYEGISKGGENGNPWLWQGAGENVNAWQYYSNIIAAYQMPLIVQTVGVQTEIESFYSSDSFAPQYAAWNPVFTTVSINPLVNLQFSKKHNLIIQLGFSSRRSFTAASASADNDLAKVFESREWYFKRLALSYSFSL